MKLSIKHSQGSATADELQRLSDFINLIIGEMGLPPDHITDIVVADEDHFGAAVEELCPGAGFTNDGVYLAIGKTFHRREAAGTCAIISSSCWRHEQRIAAAKTSLN